MTRLIGAAFFLLFLSGQGIAAPMRIMSLKLCTDELLMDLVPSSRIASVTYLSRDQAFLKHWPEAAHLSINHNSPEEVLATRPDLVLTDNFTSPVMRHLLAQSGIPFLEVPIAENFAQIPSSVRLVGKAVGEEARAEALVAHMNATIAQLRAASPQRRIRVVAWSGGGYAPGRGSLFDAVLELAGGVDIARNDTYYDTESLIAARPDVIVYGDAYSDRPSLRLDQNAHPLILKLFGRRRIAYPTTAAFDCGLPESADAAKALRTAMLQAMTKPGGVP